MCARALRIMVLKSAGNFTRDECPDLNAEKFSESNVLCHGYGICCVLAIFERRRGRLGSKISGYGQLAEVAVYFAMSGKADTIRKGRHVRGVKSELKRPNFQGPLFPPRSRLAAPLMTLSRVRLSPHCLAADRHMLSDHERRFLLMQRVGHLATADSRAIPHVVPVCFTISQGTLYITVDEKPKRVAGPALKRVRNIERNPMVAIVVDRYDEDWTRLGWVMLRGRAEILRAGTEHDRAQELLRSRYRQLAAMQIAERPVIAVRLERVTSWGNLSVGADEANHNGQA
jgi:PPOX class probable F420-dependent enzyme